MVAKAEKAGIRTTGEHVPLVGRERELEELEAGLSEASAGQGRLFLIAGEPGIGKTSLAEAVAERGSDQGMLPLWGRAWESAGAPAYWPWTQLLRTLVAGRETSLLEAEIGASGPWLVQVLPELSERLPGIGTGRSPTSEKARFALFDAVATFLRDAAASAPLVIVLDDLHAADPGSLLMFEFVARAAIGAPILLIATFQQAAARQRPDVERLLGALARESRKLVLKGVGEEGIGAIVEHRSGTTWPPELLNALYETTEGNPFFTAEVVRLLSGDGSPGTLVDDHGRVRFPLPDSVRETVRRRLEALGPETVEVLEVAAVIGREFRIATVDLATSTETPLIDLIDKAASAGVVTEVPGSIGRVRFTHNLIRESLYADLGTARRIKLHRLVAEAIEENYGETADRFAELAHHFAEASPAGDATKALDYAVRAGDEATRLYAYEQAAQLYQLAIEMGDALGPDAKRKAGLMLALGQAHAHADHRGARETLIAAGEAALAADEPGLLAEAALSMRAWPLGAGVLDDQPGALLSEALERLDEGDTPLRARLLARLGAALYYLPETEERRKALGEEAVAMARRLGDSETLAHVLANAQIATWGPDYTERDRDWAEELLPLVHGIGNDALELNARNRQIDTLIELGDLPAADAALRALELSVNEGTDPRAEGFVCLQRARHAIIEGRYLEAERLNAEAARVASRVRDTNMVFVANNQVAGLRWTQGRLGELEDEVRKTAETDTTPAWLAGLARVSCEVGKEPEARRVFERMAMNDFGDLPRYNGWLVTMGLLAETSIALGDMQRAKKLYELLHPFADRIMTTSQAIYAGPVARFLGILAAALGEWDKATGHFAAARETALRMNSPPVLMRVALDEAEMLAKRGRPGDHDRALTLLEEAQPIAAELGVERIAGRIEALRRELGGKVDVPSPEVVAGPDTDFAELRREGDVWAFEYGPRSIAVRDSKGVRHIAFLLANPSLEVHAIELIGADGGQAERGRSGGVREDLHGIAGDDAGPMLDEKAKAAYRHRLEDLQEEIEEAEAFNDPERLARAREEFDFITSQLAGAVGLGGRDRKSSSGAERARVSVTKAIRSTIKRVTEHDPVLGRELDTTIRTGTFCSYEPDPRHPLSWRVHQG